MKVLKKIIIVIVIIIAIPLIAGLFIKSEYSVVKEVTIQKPRQEVFDYIKFLRNQDNFSVWNQRDPEMKKGLTGTDGEVGAVASWDSQNEEVGAGEQEIKNITDGERIDFELRFLRPFEATDNAYFALEDAENGTLVKWGFDGKMPYPWNIMGLFVDMEEMLGPDLQQGLDNLKEVMDAMKSTPKLDIAEAEVEIIPVLYVSEVSSLNSEEIGGKIGAAYGEIMSLVGIAKLEMAGAPLSITTKFSMEEMMIEFNPAIPVVEIPEGLELSGRIQQGETYAGKVLKTTHTGSYENLHSTYEAIMAHIKENGYEINGDSWEQYIDDPTEVKEEELRTIIYFPIK